MVTRFVTAIALAIVLAIATKAYAADWNCVWQSASCIMAWTTPGFNAGDFTGGGGTWTVASGDVTTYEYVVLGKMMFVNFQIYTTTVSGTTNALSIAIPASKVATHETEIPVTIIDNGSNTTGRAIVSASGTTIVVKRTNDANFAASSDATYILGQIVFQIN